MSRVVFYSDDQGKSCHEGKPCRWALPIFGCVTDEEKR